MAGHAPMRIVWRCASCKYSGNLVHWPSCASCGSDTRPPEPEPDKPGKVKP